jgi:hypothetical protein
MAGAKSNVPASPVIAGSSAGTFSTATTTSSFVRV